MFKEIPYKKKFYAILGLFVLLSFVAYKRSFRGTIEAISFYSESKANIKKNTNVETELIRLQTELQTMDATIGKSVKNPEIVQNKILGFLSELDNDITLAKIDNIHISSDNYFKVYSNKISLKGDFNALLKTIYSFEKDFEYARIATMKFYTKKDRRTKKTELYNDIIFQNYEKKK